MATNLFTKWPLWHYFTLHFQNLPLYNDEVRRYRISASGIPAATEPVLGGVIGDIMVYDFMNDRILPAGQIPGLLIINFSELSNQSVMAGIPADAPLIAKGTAVVQDGIMRGGEFVPIIGTKENMMLVSEAIFSQYNALQGRGQPIDVMSRLSTSEKERVQNLLNAPVYSNPIIGIILQSYARMSMGDVAQTRGLSDVIARIRSKLQRSLTELQAINAATGAIVRATSATYNIQEMSIVPQEGSERKIMRFAFPVNPAAYSTKGFTEQQLRDALRDAFSAQPVRASEVAERERATVSLRPIRMAAADYANLFNVGESFQTYISQLDRITQAQAIDTTQILHTQAQPSFAGEGIEAEDLEEEDVDFDEY